MREHGRTHREGSKKSQAKKPDKKPDHGGGERESKAEERPLLLLSTLA
jgi:hypothetical protein